MASHTSRVHHTTRPHGARSSRAVTAWVALAASLMIFNGIMAMLSGIAAIANDEVFVTTRNYVFEFDLTAWGWIHLMIGLGVVLAGVSLFQGSRWARVVGIGLAGLSMIASFMWLPYAPVWAVTIIGLDAIIIWALCKAQSTD
ncbi:DUF7144 family membrane protein [Streptomyces sp. enrichment culture]|uniref:DUF7144 family membrane protein n=1 Tax=Streptomyces sp. enrichment culture TaxID=1795815 RepID=UPI003F5770DD